MAPHEVPKIRDTLPQMPSLSDPSVWQSSPCTVHQDGSLHFLVIPSSARMEVIVRDQSELFETTVERAYNNNPFVCAINGPQYSVSIRGLLDAAYRSDPVAANRTTADGLIIREGSDTIGQSASMMFYIAQTLGQYEFGPGDPPANATQAVGGVGPMIINGLRYGVGNVCQSMACPDSGPVPSEMQGDLIQRNNLTYADQQSRPNTTGKAIIAANTNEAKLLVIVQRDGATGISFDDLNNTLVSIGCDNAVFLDGSDSAMLHANGVFHVRPGSDKNETNTIGIAFYMTC